MVESFYTGAAETDMISGMCDCALPRGGWLIPRFARAIALAAILVLVTSLQWVPQALAQEEGPIERLERLGRALRAHSVWRASYHQEYVAAGMTAGEEVDGTVWVSWPDRALFRAGEPVIRIMGMEGRRVRLVDLEVIGCDDHLIDDEEWARIPLAAVLDPQQAVDRFTVLESGEDGLVLIPHETGGVARVEVKLGPGGLPAEVTVIDPQGATNRLGFSDWQRADRPLGGQWLPTPPADIECVGEE
jgi:hypothetical protein